MIFKVSLATFLAGISGTLAKRVLASLGMGMVSFTAVTVALNALIVSAQSAYASVSGVILQLLGLAGFGTGLGMLTAALTFRAMYMALPKLGALVK